MLQSLAKRMTRLKTLNILKNRILFNFPTMKRGFSASLFFIILAAFYSCGYESGKSYFDEGELLKERGKYSEAIEKYNYVVLHHAKESVAPEALYRMGEIYYRHLNEYEPAIVAFRRILIDYPRSVKCRPAQRHIAEIYMYKLNDYKNAIIEYQKAIPYYAGSRDSERFQYEVANAYFNLKNFEQQRVELNLLLERYPATELQGEIYLQIGSSYYVEGRLDDALKTYRGVVKKFPSTPLSLEASFQIAVCLEEKENLTGALEALKEIENIYPNPKIVRNRIERIEKRLKRRRR